MFGKSCKPPGSPLLGFSEPFMELVTEETKPRACLATGSAPPQQLTQPLYASVSSSVKWDNDGTHSTGPW